MIPCYIVPDTEIVENLPLRLFASFAVFFLIVEQNKPLRTRRRMLFEPDRVLEAVIKVFLYSVDSHKFYTLPPGMLNGVKLLTRGVEGTPSSQPVFSRNPSTQTSQDDKVYLTFF